MFTEVVQGSTVDEQTRCVHYGSELDVVGIKFYCCGEYYPCYRCHDEWADHAIETWPVDSRDEPAVLCGVCRQTIAIDAYLAGLSAHPECPYCAAPFNPGCAMHTEHYFASR